MEIPILGGNSLEIWGTNLESRSKIELEFVCQKNPAVAKMLENLDLDNFWFKMLKRLYSSVGFNFCLFFLFSPAFSPFPSPLKTLASSHRLTDWQQYVRERFPPDPALHRIQPSIVSFVEGQACLVLPAAVQGSCPGDLRSTTEKWAKSQFTGHAQRKCSHFYPANLLNYHIKQNPRRVNCDEAARFSAGPFISYRRTCLVSQASSFSLLCRSCCSRFLYAKTLYTLVFCNYVHSFSISC